MVQKIEIAQGVYAIYYIPDHKVIAWCTEDKWAEALVNYFNEVILT